jgi:hypothetical protein
MRSRKTAETLFLELNTKSAQGHILQSQSNVRIATDLAQIFYFRICKHVIQFV